jgi:hypothetical protein
MKHVLLTTTVNAHGLSLIRAIAKTLEVHHKNVFGVIS